MDTSHLLAEGVPTRCAVRTPQQLQTVRNGMTLESRGVKSYILTILGRVNCHGFLLGMKKLVSLQHYYPPLFQNLLGKVWLLTWLKRRVGGGRGAGPETPDNPEGGVQGVGVT